MSYVLMLLRIDIMKTRIFKNLVGTCFHVARGQPIRFVKAFDADPQAVGCHPCTDFGDDEHLGDRYTSSFVIYYNLWHHHLQRAF
jgi:hypothetical protein